MRAPPKKALVPIRYRRPPLRDKRPLFFSGFGADPAPARRFFLLPPPLTTITKKALGVNVFPRRESKRTSGQRPPRPIPETPTPFLWGYSDYDEIERSAFINADNQQGGDANEPSAADIQGLSNLPLLFDVRRGVEAREEDLLPPVS